MCSAIFRRSPRSGTRSSRGSAARGGAAAPGTARFTSSAVTAPPGPLPAIDSIATPSCFANWRTAGVACTRPPALAPTWGAGAGAPAPSTSIVMIVAPTFTTCPSLAWRAATTPLRGDGMSTVALSVITSTSGWSSFTASPGWTSQRTISPSATPSPMSGSFTS